MANETSKSVHSCDRLAGEVSSHQPTSYLASKNAWEGHGDSACRFTSTHGRGENRSGRLADAVLCAGAAAHGNWKESQFRLWNFAWDRLASRMYAATHTMFLMKTIFIKCPFNLENKIGICGSLGEHQIYNKTNCWKVQCDVISWNCEDGRENVHTWAQTSVTQPHNSMAIVSRTT